MLVPAFLIDTHKRRIAALAIGVNLVLGIAVYHWPDIARLSGTTLTAKTDPYKRARGWQALSRITSYNVCYTKLLRHRDVACGLPGDWRRRSMGHRGQRGAFSPHPVADDRPAR